MQYDLENLGPEKFEHVAQALLLRYLGGRTKIFGQGKDGGREFTYEGKVQWSEGRAASDEWDGYVVGQAKYRSDRLGTSQDQEWFLGQVDAEMAAWANPKSERRKKGRLPEYLLFVTNVRLSAAAGGGVDRFDQLMQTYQEPTQLRGWHVLHREALERMLDDNRDVRRRYAALISPADVFACTQELIGINETLERALSKHAAKLISSERIIRLSEQGLQSSDKFYLENVGMDLPAEMRTPNGRMRAVDAAKHIIQHGETVLSPRAKGKPAGPVHFVIVGDPGQGKTTLSQMITQFYRVALLAGRDRDTLPPKVCEVLDATEQTMERLRIQTPKNRRWPIRVDLAEYGDAIAGGVDLSLLRWITRQVRTRVDEEITNAGMLSWLQNWPWLLVLDGLDEVAHPDIREALRQQVDDFILEAADSEADLLVVVTTRPQGYDRTFEESDFAHLRLTALEKSAALRYARRLAEVRHPDDEELQAASVARLASASEEPITARLMSTPLQVTIMLILLEIALKVPTNRYDLFSAYFETIYSREANKKGHLARILELRKSDVVAIHQQVGLQLQMESEETNNAEAVLGREQLRHIVSVRLRSEGLTDGELERVEEQLVKAALNRLVLLVPRGAGFGFEIRSLQEFLAATAISTGPEALVLQRLKVIAPSAHWRNTWLLSLSQVFTNLEHLRPSAVSGLQELDASDALGMAVPLGPDLALAVLKDGVAQRSPVFMRLLLKHGLEVLESPRVRGADEIAPLLCELAESDDQAYRMITARIQDATEGNPRRRAAACLLMQEVHRRRSAGNPLWTFVRDYLPIALRHMGPEEERVFTAWSDGASLMSDDPAPLEGDLDLPLGEFLERAGSRLRDGQEGDDSGVVRAFLEDLNASSIRLLGPDRLYAFPPTDRPRSAHVQSLLSDQELGNRISGALSSLRPGLWAPTAHINELLRTARERVPVHEELRKLGS